MFTFLLVVQAVVAALLVTLILMQRFLQLPKVFMKPVAKKRLCNTTTVIYISSRCVWLKTSTK